MYSLFKLVRLITVKNEINPVAIENFAWRQHGESCLLAISCSNGFLVLQYSCPGCQPAVKQLRWPPDHPITSLCFDPTVTWLLVQTDNGNIFILPALSMLDPGSQVNQLWRVDDITIVTCLKPRGLPTVTVWWNTLDGLHIAVVATKLGEVLFVDLLKQCLVSDRCVDEHIRHMELVTDDQQTMTHLLITGNSGKQWKMLLEKRVTKVAAHDTELSDLGYDHIDGLSLPVLSVLNKLGEEEEDIFAPTVLTQFARSVTLKPQYAKGRHMITAYCTKNSTYQVYDSNLEHNPLFVYRLPVGALNTVLTDRIMFMTTRLAGDQKLIVLSNQKAEISEDLDQDFSIEAVLQKFDFPTDERIKAILQKSFPFYWHERLEEEQVKLLNDPDDQKQTSSDSIKMPSAVEIPLSTHTVLDGCIIITDDAVYECRPRVSPERLFLELCISQSDSKLVEQLGISLGLDLNFLFEVAAEFLLLHGNSKHATRLFHMSKGSPVSRISSFAKYGYIHEILPFLQQLLRKDNSGLSTDEMRQLVELGVHGLLLRLTEEQENKELANTFREFILEFSEHEDLQKATLRLLTEAGLQSILLDFAMDRGLVIEALHELARQGQYQLTEDTLDKLISRGYGGHLAQVASGSFLQMLDAGRMVKIFCERPQILSLHSDLLLHQLHNLDSASLLKLAEVLDPSRPLIRGYVQRKLHSRRRTSSLTSLTGSVDLGDTVTSNVKEVSNVDASRLVHCFLMVILHLNNRRLQDRGTVYSDFLFENIADLVKQAVETGHAVRQKICSKPSPIGCGPTHSAAALKNGDLYTWGKSSHGRLGHGEQTGSTVCCGPCKVANLHTLQIKVTSVACGMVHTIALTQQGVYGWGSSKYGQVGLGTQHVYTRPMPIEELSKTLCVAVDCGQYHSVALTDDAQMYSWGWGVHGQLGHGDTEERLVPKLVTAFSNMVITKVAAGYCHTLALNSQGELYSFGCGFFGQLGLGTSNKHTLPVRVTAISEKITTIATKFFHSLAVDTHNRVYHWGSHPHGLRHFVHSRRRGQGQAVFEQADSHLRPRVVDTTYVNGKIKQVVCGSFHSSILTKDGDVYTWGRNLDGQLGNGSRQDGRIPQMVTSINDRHIVHLNSGGEYNVAMDSDGQIWVWGRNEFCQLGLQPSDAKQTNKVIKMAGSMNVGQNLTEVLVPTQLSLFPGSPASTWQHGSSLLESFSISESLESLTSWTEEDGEMEGYINLPNLAEIGDLPYDRVIIPVMLQCASSLCDCNQLLRDAVDLQDWVVAASVNLYLRNYSQAMSYHLMSVRTSVAVKEDLSEYSMNIVRHYYKLMNSSGQPVEEEKRHFLYQVLYHWETERLNLSLLEDFLDSVMEQLALLLGAVLFRKSDSQKEMERNDENFRLLRPTATFCSSFSSKFCLKLSSAVLRQLQTDNLADSSSLFMLQKLGSKDLNSVPECLCGGDKLPYDQLWQDIMQNLQKGKDGRKYIYVTHSELDRLDEHQADSDQCQVQVIPAMFFTCGHYFTKTSFSKELEKVNKEAVFTSIKIPETFSILKEYYSRKGCVPLACPRCVVSAIMAIS